MTTHQGIAYQLMGERDTARGMAKQAMTKMDAMQAQITELQSERTNMVTFGQKLEQDLKLSQASLAELQAKASVIDSGDTAVVAKLKGRFDHCTTGKR